VSRARAQQAVPLPSTDLDQLLRRVRALAENRPAVYQMFDATGRVLYVGKAKRLRTRLLTYFRATYPDDKAARILYAAHEIRWDYVPSEFAAYLGELRQIRKFRPYFNHKGNRTRRSVLIKIAGGPAPRVYGGGAVMREDVRCFGPFQSMARMLEAVRTLNDLLGLRDCPTTTPVQFAGQGDLFDQPRQAACMRHELGFCTGPCAGLVSEREYQRRVDTAIAFLEGRTVQPIDHVVQTMLQASANAHFEIAARWREKFEQLEWLLAATSRARSAIDLLTFVYRDPGDFGDDRVYLLRRGVVRASYPYPATPIEHDAFRAVVAEEARQPTRSTDPLPMDSVDEVLLMMAWFRAHPDALRRTTPYEQWV
jgi:excinuclease ABC subunit C